jgi:hypothetical protein
MKYKTHFQADNSHHRNCLRQNLIPYPHTHFHWLEKEIISAVVINAIIIIIIISGSGGGGGSNISTPHKSSWCNA